MEVPVSTIKWMSTQPLEQSINQHKESIKIKQASYGHNRSLIVFLHFDSRRDVSPQQKTMVSKANPSPIQEELAPALHVFQGPHCKDLPLCSSPVGLIHVLTRHAVSPCLQLMSALVPTTTKCCFLWVRPRMSRILTWPSAAPAALWPCWGSHCHPALGWAKDHGQGGCWLQGQRMGSSSSIQGCTQPLQLTSWGWGDRLWVIHASVFCDLLPSAENNA